MTDSPGFAPYPPIHGSTDCRLACAFAVKPCAFRRTAARPRGLTAQRAKPRGIHAANAGICRLCKTTAMRPDAAQATGCPRACRLD
jgi:hypothetical protein